MPTQWRCERRNDSMKHVIAEHTLKQDVCIHEHRRSMHNSVNPMSSEKARTVVVPLRVGGGSRIKIREAMASAVPVVSTTIGAEGLELEPGRHAFIADSPDTFAAACVRALQLNDDVEEMITAALERAGQYAPEVVSTRMQQVAQDITTRSRCSTT